MPNIPKTRAIGRQIYTLIGTRPYFRSDGSETVILVWQTWCAECGELMVTTTSQSGKFHPNRRCAKHKRGRRRVGKIAQPLLHGTRLNDY